jgi:hypothetical protein
MRSLRHARQKSLHLASRLSASAGPTSPRLRTLVEDKRLGAHYRARSRIRTVLWVCIGGACLFTLFHLLLGASLSKSGGTDAFDASLQTPTGIVTVRPGSFRVGSC